MTDKKTTIRGSGGGGGSQRAPIESPDSLRSIAYARILDLVSEGEIYGFANKDNPLSCVFLNETPVANADGSLNFKNIQIDSRTGTQTQDIIRGFPSVESENAVGVELRYDTPWTRAFSDLDLDAVNVRLSVPIFQKTNTTNGDITGTNVQYQIELSVDGGPFNPKLITSFTGKTTTKYERGHRLDLPPATTGWTVRVRRLTPDSTSGALVNATYVEAYTEIIDAKLRYPMCALVGVTVDAEQFGNIPSRSYRMKGLLIKVPSNYDPDTRTYTGVWDGTFQTRYSNNPAWVYYDLATNPRYGLGRYITPNQVNRWELYRIAQYCDGMVDDGFGGLEPRFTCNVYLQVQNDAYKVMQDLASVFRGIQYAAGGILNAVADMPETPHYCYTPANVVDGRFTYSGSGRKVRHTVALVSWNDMTDFCRAKIEYVDDEEGIARYGIQPLNVIAVGCTSQGQARRVGKFVLATERFETQGVTFGVGADGTIVAPGKLILIADPLKAGRRTGGRVSASTINSITVDELPVVAAGDTLHVMLATGDLESRTVQSVDEPNKRIFVSLNFTDAPLVQSVWSVESAELVPQKFRVLGVSENDDGSGYVVNAIQHIEGKYAYVEQGIQIQLPPISTLPGRVVPSPQNLQCVQREIVDQNTVQKAATLSWDAVAVATSYNVQWRQGEGSWVDLGNNASTNREIHNILPGPFEVQVVAINALGIRSLPSFGGPYDIGPVTQPPGYVDEINGDVDELRDDLAQEVIDRAQGDLDEAAARSAAIAAEAAARAAAILNEQLTREAAIANEQTLRQNADESLANAISTLSAGTGEQFDSKKVWYFDTDLESWTGSPDGAPTVTNGFIRPANGGSPYLNSPTGLNVNGDAYKYVKLRLNKQGNPTWFGRVIGYNASNAVIGQRDVPAPVYQADGDATVDFLDIPWAGTVDHIRVQLYEAQSATDYVTVDWIALGRPAPGASVAALQEESQARIQGDQAEAAQRTTLAAQMRGDYEGTNVADLTTGLVFSEREARVSADSALAEDITALEARVSTNEGGLTAVSGAVSALTARVDTAEDTIEVHTSQLTTLNARVDDNDALIAANANAIATLDTRVTNAENEITSQASSITSLQASLSDIGDPKPNLIHNPTGAYGAQGWVQNGAVGFEAVFGSVNGNYFRMTGDVTTVTSSYSYDVSAQANTSYALSMEMANTNGSVSSNFYFDMQFLDASNAVLASSTAVTYTASPNFRRKNVVAVSPANTVTVRIRAVAQGHASAVTRMMWRRVKLEANTVATPYNDEGQNNATAGAQTILEARVTSAEGNITANSAAITSINSVLPGKADVSAVTALTTRVSEIETDGNVNLLANTAFKTDLNGWQLVANAIGGQAMQRDWHGFTWQPAEMHAIVLGANNEGAIGTAFAGAYVNRIPVIAGEKYCLSAYLAAHRINGGVQMAVYDQNANLLQVFNNEGPVAGAGQNLLTDYTRKFVIGTMPANAKWVDIYLYMRKSQEPAGNNPWLWIIRPMLERCRPGQTGPTAWNPGGLEMSATYTLKLDVNGYITGWNFNNNGTSGNLTIHADMFSIVKPGGGARTEYSGGNWRVYDGAGTLRVRMGIW